MLKNIDEARERANLHYKRVRQQIVIEQEKNKRYDEELKEKQERVYHKSLINPFLPVKETDFEVPVDGEIERGSQVFMANCSGCHAMTASSSSSNTNGPSLGLIYNRKAGSDPTYLGYS